MDSFIDQIQNYESKKLEKIEPCRWGPWIEYFDSETKHPYFYNELTKETVW